MKLIGAGLGRTGTKSLQDALQTLGFNPCYHMTEFLEHPEHAKGWMAAADNQPVDWKHFLRNYQASVDFPGCAYYKEMMVAFPDAKVLLSVRDPEAWYESCRNTIFKITQVFPVALARKLMPWLPFAAPGRIASRMIWQQTFDNRFADKAYALEVFHRHIEEVKQYVKPERLLVFDVKEGWEPLCRFLEVPVPKDKPFPRLNDTQEFQQNIKRVQIMSSAALGLGAVGTIALLRWLGRR